jgi:hypothetical protein
MPFIIPAAAIGAGVSLIVWGSKMFLSNDDSADKNAQEVLSEIPSQFEKYISNISVKSTGIHITFKTGTPGYVKDEIRTNIKPG